MKNEVQLWEVYKVTPKFVKDGKEFLAYQFRIWPSPFSSPMMEFIGLFEGFNEYEAIRNSLKTL